MAKEATSILKRVSRRVRDPKPGGRCAALLHTWFSVTCLGWGHLARNSKSGRGRDPSPWAPMIVSVILLFKELCVLS